MSEDLHIAYTNETGESGAEATPVCGEVYISKRSYCPSHPPVVRKRWFRVEQLRRRGPKFCGLETMPARPDATVEVLTLISSKGY